MIRRIAIVSIIAAALLAPLSAAPAGAGANPNPGPAGCLGNGCSILLSKLITLTGDVGTGAGFPPIAVDPPPCLWEPFGNAVTGSERVASESALLAELPPGSNPLGLAVAVREAKHLLSTHAPPSAGTWFELSGNPAAGTAGALACLKLPLFVFELQGQAPPALPIPPRTLAEFAYNHMLIPQPAITTNPAAKGYVNLGTYVWGNWAASPTTGSMNAYKITATLGNLTVTVWAQASGFSVNVTGPGTPYSGGCGPTGSHFPVGKPPAGAGPGTLPDCGVLWQAPTTGAALTATVRWTVTWGVGNLNGPGNNVLPPIVVAGPAPPFVVPVNEIQSVNGG
jgi:hypothetical protein